MEAGESMNRCSFWCAGPWPFIVLPLLLLLVVLFFEWRDIESDVANNAKSDLALADADWATVETRSRGREVLITGTAPNEEAILLAKQTSEKSYGVNSVTVSANVQAPIIPLKPASLEAIVKLDSITLKGTVADQSTIDSLIAKAMKAFNEGDIENQLVLADNIAELPELSGFFSALTDKTSEAKALTASLIGTKLDLTGTINSAESNTALNAYMSQTLKLDVNNRLSVALPPIEEHDRCLDDVNELLSSSRINFATGKAVIEQSSYELLASIKETALKCPDANFEISGHTDSTGALSSNISLSERRAQAVLNHLESLGLNVTQFTAVGYGPEQPIADNATQEGRAKNRRIEFKLKN